VLGEMQCPYLVLHGGHDVLGVENSRTVYEHAKKHGVDVTLRLTSEEETGAEHCQHDNPTLGQELMIDWLADVLRIDQRSLAFN
jgi:dipeptidyl aminopeptidase/acylaminoacyl peptidase